MPDSTREEILNSLNRELPDSISEIVFEMCADKKRLPGFPLTSSKEEYKETETQKSEGEYKEEEEKEKRLKKERERWEKTVTLHGEEYVRTAGFVRSEGNLDYMLENNNWDATNKTLEENIAFDARDTSFGDVYGTKIEHLT